MRWEDLPLEERDRLWERVGGRAADRLEDLARRFADAAGIHPWEALAMLCAAVRARLARAAQRPTDGPAETCGGDHA